MKTLLACLGMVLAVYLLIHLSAITHLSSRDMKQETVMRAVYDRMRREPDATNEEMAQWPETQALRKLFDDPSASRPSN